MQGMADDLTTATQQATEQHATDYHNGAITFLHEVCQAVKAWIEATTIQGDHAAYSLTQVLASLTEHGLQIKSAPYHVEIQALAPAGYPIKITIAKDNAGELVTELQNVIAWLNAQSYKLVG
jgi:hypothetical protein